MIRGSVSRFKARIPLRVQGANGQVVTIEACVDTGFNGMLSLPTDLIASLDLPWEGESSGILADGRTSYFDVFKATVVWHGRTHAVTVSALDMVPSVGMSLLEGSELNVKVRPGGTVAIKPMRRHGG